MASEEQYRLINDIFHKKGYNKVIRPVINETTPIFITTELYLSQINDVVST